MDFQSFKKWINWYPFIRMQIKESMMPRIWTLRHAIVVKKEVIATPSPSVFDLKLTPPF